MDDTAAEWTEAPLRPALWLALMFAAAKLLFHIGSTLWQRHIGYGYFRDEFYYIACGRHLAWGYVDHGPLVAVQARVSEVLFGDSLLGIRVLSALGGAIRVGLTGLLCWALGGKRSAQALAMLAVLTVPLYLGGDGYLSMNSWESAFWMPCLLALLMVQRGGSAWVWWTVLGISAGLGLLNKPSEVFFLLALGAALLLTSQRRLLFTQQAAFGIALLIVIALPNVLWQVHHSWPTLEFLRNGRLQGKNLQLPPLKFLLNQFLVLGPLGAAVWVTGLVHLLRRADRRWLGLTYLFFLAGMMALGAKDYYVAPVYPVLFAAGGVAWQNRFHRSPGVLRNRTVAFPLFEGAVCLMALVLLPASNPVLRPQTFLRYAAALHLPNTDAESVHAALPQFYADRFGWQEQVNTVSRIVAQLSPADRARVGIFCGNYGEAGAMEFLGRGLPPVISEHNNYWLWGTRGLDADAMIIDAHTTADKLRRYYEQVEVVGQADHPLAMPFEHHSIFLVRRRRVPLQQDWAASKFYY